MTDQPTPHQRLTRAGHSAAFADLVLNQHAHQLAETIRKAWADHDPKKPGNVTMLSALNAADLIDSEAQR